MGPSNNECTEKNHPRGARRGICGGVGAVHTPTYTGSPLAFNIFSVDSITLNLEKGNFYVEFT
jgi:hypothetical protein